MNDNHQTRDKKRPGEALSDHRIAQRFLDHIKAQIERTRAQYDLLQSLRDRLTAELEKDWADFWATIDSAARAAGNGAPEEKSPVAKQPVSRLRRGRVASLAKQVNRRLRKSDELKPVQPRRGAHFGEIVSWVKGRDGTFTTDDLRVQFHELKQGTRSSSLDKLLKAGLIERTARSTYRWVGGAGTTGKLMAKESAYRELRDGMHLPPVPEVKTSLDR